MRAVAVLTPVPLPDARAFCRRYGVHDVEAIVGVPAGSVNSNFALRDFPQAAPASSSGSTRSRTGRGRWPRRRSCTRSPRRASPRRRRSPRAMGALPSESSPASPRRSFRGATAACVVRPPCRRGTREPSGRRWPGSTSRSSRCAPPLEPLSGHEDLLVRLDRTSPAKARPELAAQAEPLRAKLEQCARRRDPTLPRGLIHGDLFRDNVLWQGDRIAALLDFESASEGALAYDLMVTALAWCFGDALDQALLRAMIDGYESVRPLSASERAALVTEGSAAALRFTITRITDYAMRVTGEPRVIKDWRRFAMRLAALESTTQLP